MSEIRVFEIYPPAAVPDTAPPPVAKTPPPATTPPGQRDIWPILMGLPSLIVLMLYAAPGIGWWAVAVPVLVYAAGFLAYRNLASTDRTRSETVAVLARLPEIEGLIERGTAVRRSELARAVATRLGLAPGEVALVTTAARCRDVGLGGATSDAGDRPGFDTAAVARWSGEVVGRIGGLEDVAGLVGDPAEPRPPRLDALRTVVEVVAAYDEAVEQNGLTPEGAIAHLNDAHDESAIPALRALRDLVATPAPVY